MAEYLNARCSICGQKYHVCSDCTNTKSFTPWRKVACSIDCYKIFMALSLYTNRYATKEETREIIKGYDLSKLDTFEDNIKTSIQEILKETKPKKIRSTTNKAIEKDIETITNNVNEENIVGNDNE